MMKFRHEEVPDSTFYKGELEEATKIEMREHGVSKRIGRAIAKAHLIETGRKDPTTGKIGSDYYKELKKLEKRLKRR